MKKPYEHWTNSVLLKSASQIYRAMEGKSSVKKEIFYGQQNSSFGLTIDKYVIGFVSGEIQCQWPWCENNSLKIISPIP